MSENFLIFEIGDIVVQRLGIKFCFPNKYSCCGQVENVEKVFGNQNMLQKNFYKRNKKISSLKMVA